VAAREPLRAARDLFDTLGTVGWGARARAELAAAGEASEECRPAAWSTLTPQEWQIAQLAAAGLTNSEIGEQLLISRRTVGSHLYHLFPKLGVTARSQLADALSAAEPTAGAPAGLSRRAYRRPGGTRVRSIGRVLNSTTLIFRTDAWLRVPRKASPAVQPTATAPSTPDSIRLTGGPDEAWRVGRGQPAFIAHQEPAALSTAVARADRSRSGR
jgi:DNA-binding CsgD family transcriptional regulator